MTSAPVARIIPFSAVDGPGNRSAVFLQGCNQNCLYCHNPETINMCSSCGACVRYCKTGALEVVDGTVSYDFFRCIWCDECIRHCPSDSNPRIRNLTACQVMETLETALPFVRGVTVSGGECTLYPDFLCELSDLVQAKGKTFFVDTNGQVDLGKMPALVQAADSFMVDLKASDPKGFLSLTGNANDNVVKNISMLLGCGKLYEIRTVLVPNAMDMEATVRLGASLVSGHPEVRYKLIRYRENGVRESMRYLESPSDEQLDRLVRILSDHGVSNVVVV